MAWRSQHPDFVEQRLATGSLCHVCPLRGRRKVGHDGPPDADVVVLAEAPGEKEEQHMVGKVQYGRPLVGPSGYMTKVRYLAPAGLVTLLPNPREPEYPIVAELKAHLMNVIMCRPPKNKIESKEGKKAVWCCANSARAHLRAMIERNPKLGIIAVGGTAMDLVKGAQHKGQKKLAKGAKRKKDSIEKLRGRPFQMDMRALEPIPEALIYKKALAGVKPPPEFVEFLKFPIGLRWVLKMNRMSLRRSLKPPKEKKCATSSKTPSPSVKKPRSKRTKTAQSEG